MKVQLIRQFNKKEFEELKKLLITLKKPSGACSLTFAGKSHIFHVLSASDNKFPNSSAIDSGAIDHMMNSFHQFSSYNSPYPSNKNLATAENGSWRRIDSIKPSYFKKCLTSSKVVYQFCFSSKAHSGLEL